MAQQWNKVYDKTPFGRVSKKLGWADPLQQYIRETAENANAEDAQIKADEAAYAGKQSSVAGELALASKEKKQRATVKHKAAGLQSSAVTNTSLLR